MNGLILFVYLTQVCLCTQCYICIAQNSSLRAWTLRCYAGGAALIARGILSNIRSSLCTSLECVVIKTLSNYKDVIRYVCISSCKIRKRFRPCSFTWYWVSISWNICKKDYASSRSHIRKGTAIYVCFMYMYFLTHWGRATHICVSKLTIIGSDNDLPPGRCQAIIWTNAGILLIGTLGTNFSEILSEIHTFSFKKIRLKTSSAKWRPFCLDLNELRDLIMFQDIHWLSPHSCNIFNILKPRQNGHYFTHDVFKSIFVNENLLILIKHPLKFIPKGPINNIPALVQVMAWRQSGDKPLSEWPISRQANTWTYGHTITDI